MSSKSGLRRSNRYRGALKRVFAVFIAALGRGWRHRLLIRRLIATTTIEMLGTETSMIRHAITGGYRIIIRNHGVTRATIVGLSAFIEIR